ncbi:MAG: DUF1573 domain-containing protein [Thermoflexibacter sp.]|nr:DUF1573 domain-containing protein [Thermoflexibacter sp.]
MKSLITSFVLLLAVGLFACQDKQASSSTEVTTTTPAMQTSNATDNNVATATTAPNEAKLAKIEFDQNQHDFGNIKAGEIVKHKFKFKNIGDVPLVISDVKPTCGCTTTNFTKTPVPPGNEGEIELQFDSSGKSGPQHKPVTVLANVEGGQTQLVLTAVVASQPTIAGPYRNQ